MSDSLPETTGEQVHEALTCMVAKDAHFDEKETDADMEGVPLVSIEDEREEEVTTQLVVDDDEVVVASAAYEQPRARKMAVKPPRKTIHLQKDDEEKDGESGSKEEGEGNESEEDSESCAVEAEVVQNAGEEEEVDMSDDDAQPPAAAKPSPPPSPIARRSVSPASGRAFPAIAAASASRESSEPSDEGMLTTSRRMDLIMETMHQNSMILMKQQQQNDLLISFMQHQTAQNQTNFETLFNKIDTMSSRMSQQEREINDLKRGVSFRAEDMEQGLDIISRKPNLRRVFEFIARYGMDTRTGYVVAFPQVIAGKLCVAVSLQLLSYAMAAMFPINMKPQKDFTLAGLKLLMNSVSTETVAHRTVLNFTSLFGVDSYTGTAQRQASNNLSVWRVYQATTFLKAVRMSLSHADETGLGILEPEIETSAIQWTRTSRIMWSQASMLDKTALHRMAWAQTVQEEVLADPAVKQFFQLVPTVMGTSSSSSRPSSPRGAPLPYDQPFHFCGVEPMFDFPVKSHAQLVRERRTAMQREREAMEERMQDDRIESRVVNGRNLRKRKAASSSNARGKARKTVGEMAKASKSREPASRAAKEQPRGHQSARTAGVPTFKSTAAAYSDSDSDSSSSSSASDSSNESDEEVVRAPVRTSFGVAAAAAQGAKK